MPSTQSAIKMSAMVQNILSPLGATPPSNAADYEQQAANDGDPADPGGNGALRFRGDLHVADSQDAPLGTVAEASEHYQGAHDGQYDSGNS